MSDSEQKRKIVRKSGSGTGDRRSARTRRMIQQALMELMHSMRYEDITVQHIIDKADVGRSTFYAHYLDKDDLVKGFFEEMMESITRGVKGSGGSVSFPIAEMLQHLGGQLPVHGVWQSDRGREYLFSVGTDYWNRRIERELKSRAGKRGASAVPLAVVAIMVTGAATSLLNWWMKNKMPFPPEEVQTMFDRVMMPGIRGVIDG